MAPGSHRYSLDILLIDDEPDSQNTTRALLEQAGHLVEVANTQKIALSKVRAYPFELILIDVQMQHGEGFALAQSLKLLPDCTGLAPIMALTSSRDPLDVKRCFQVGMSNFLPKPLTLSSFHEAMLPYLTHRLSLYK